MNLPEPACRFGYTQDQVEAMFGPPGEPLREAFAAFIHGQTVAICSGPTDGGAVRCPTAHGLICYPWDLQRFVNGQPVID